MDNPRVFFGMAITIIILIFMYVMKIDKVNFAEHRLQKLELLYKEKKKGWERDLNELDSLREATNKTIDSLYLEIEKKDNLLKKVKNQANTTIKKLQDEKHSISNWTLSERDSFWTRESTRREHIPDAIQVDNK